MKGIAASTRATPPDDFPVMASHLPPIVKPGSKSAKKKLAPSATVKPAISTSSPPPVRFPTIGPPSFASLSIHPPQHAQPASSASQANEAPPGVEEPVEGWKPFGNQDKEESQPAPGTPQIGIEMEGVGTVKPRVLMPSGTAHVSRNIRHLFDEMGWKNEYKKKETLKKQALVSPNEGTPDVTIHAEPLTSLDAEHRAELVTRPFGRTEQGLAELAGAVHKAQSSENPSSKTIAAFKIYSETKGKKVTREREVNTKWLNKSSAWRDKTKKWNYRGLQTTAGISAQSLLSDDEEERRRVIDYMAHDPRKRELFHGHVKTAIEAEKYLQSQRPAPSSDSSSSSDEKAAQPDGDAKYRARLALLMAIVHAHVESEGQSERRLKKDTYGLNLKGYSGFEGLGLKEGMPERRDLESLAADPNTRTKLLNPLTRGQTSGSQSSSSSSRSGDLLNKAFEKVGTKGLSTQVAHEKGTPIPTFIHGNKLHTVIESREAESGINKDMATLLEAKRTGASDASSVKLANQRLTAIGLAQRRP